MLKRDYSDREWLAVRETEAALDGFTRLASERQSRFVLCIIPDKLQVQGDYLAEYTKSLGGVDSYDPDKPSKVLEGICRDLSVDCIDLLPASRYLFGQGERLYLDGDIHWSERGRQLLSKVLAEELLALNRTADGYKTAVNVESDA
jgi:hypothetical protein